jgi:serine/threonine protein kinase
MALTKGARRLFEWLREQKAGTVIPYEQVMATADWNEKSLKTYISKNKLAPFLLPLDGNRLKVLMDGAELDEGFFHETFTQTAPRKLTLAANDQLEGENGTYELVEPLGRGAVGHVWSAKAGSTLTLVAAKVMLPREGMFQESKLPNIRERFRREARNGKSVAHPNLVQYLDAGHAEKNPFLIMELADRSVADHLQASGSIPEEEAAEIVECCVAALAYLHAKGCPHRDVKPANLLEFPNTTKLGDLGIVKWSDFDPTFTKGGTITRQSVQLGSWFYMAPEQQESPHNATEASDVYALGVTWIEMLTEKLPSPQAIGAHAYTLPDMSTAVTTLIHSMCSYLPTDRPSLAEIRDVISANYGG